MTLMVAFQPQAPDTRTMIERFAVDVDGTSHGDGITTTIERCPEGIQLDYDFIQHELTLRRPGQAFTTERQESDEFVLTEGVTSDGYTTGETLKLFVPNHGHHSHAYDKLAGVLRPGHGITMQMLKAWASGDEVETAGGGQASARLTIGKVAAGAIAQLGMDQLITDRTIEVLACMEMLGINIRTLIETDDPLTAEMIYASPVRCPDPDVSRHMQDELLLLAQTGNSIGGSVYCRVSGFPGCIGERPGVSLDSRFGSGLFDINGVKTVSIGDRNAYLGHGTETIDEISGYDGTDLHTYTNHAGGILGGMSMGGSPIEVHVGFKPTSSTRKEVITADKDHALHTIQLGSEDRHDPCIAVRGTEVVKGVVRTILFQAWLAEQT